MDENMKLGIEAVIKRMRKSADKLSSFDVNRGFTPESRMLSDAAIDLHQGANKIEDLLKIVEQLEDNPGLD